MSDYAFRQKLAEIGQNYIKSAVEKPSAPGVGPNEQYEEDLRTLGPAAFTAKYGSAAQAKRVTDVYEVDPLAIAAVKNNTRSEAELALDMGSQVTSAGVRAIGSIANLGVRGVDLAIQGLDPRAPGRYGRGELPERFMGATDTAQGVMDTIGGATDALAGALIDQESDNMKAKSAIAERGVAAKKADSQLEYDASDKSMSAMLSKVGRDITIEAEKYENNPAIVGKTANEAFGSMFPSVKATSALTKLANPAIDALGLGAKTTAAAKTAVTAAGVGAIEGQGAYDSTVSQIRDMSFEELEAGSADYKELLAEGMDPEAARDAVAVKAGEKARLVQMGFATIAGGFVSKFEGGDLVKKAAAGFDPEKTLAANLLDEGLGFVQPLAGQTVEEGFQSGTGQLSGNLAVKEFADKDLDLTEGVGEGVVQGAVGGFNATQTLLAPGELGAVFNRGTQGVTALAAVAAKAGAEAAETRADNKSPVGAKATAQNISTLDNILNKASGIFKEQAAAVKAAQEQGLPELPENVQMLMETGKKITDGFLDTESDEFVKKTATFKGDVVPGSRVKTLEKVLRKLNADAYSDPKVSKAASEFAVEETHALREFIERAQEEALKREEAAPEAGADPTPAPLSLEEQVAKLASQVMQNKLFSTGFDKAEAILNKADTPAAEAAPLTPREAITNPVGVNPARVSVTDTSTFSPNQTRALKVIEAIQSPAFAKLNAPVIDSKDRAKTRENTREELLFRDKQATWGNIPSFNTLVSLALKGGIKGLQPEGKTEIQGPGGQQVDSQDVMVRMRQLIEHQVNKFNAGVKSFEFSKANPGKNSELTFKALNPYTYQFKEDGGKFFVNAGSEGSMKTFRQVREDTNAAIRGYNALLENFPEIYKGEKIALLPELTEEAKPNVQPTQPAEAKPEPTKAEEVQSSVDPKADNASGDAQPVPADPVQYTDDGKLKPDYLEFNALFKGGTETTFLDAMKYLNSLGHMTAEQRNLFELLRNSTFFKANHNVVIRLGKPEERQSDKTHGWYNPELKEMVIFAPRISKVLHEMVHATTIEILTKNLLEAYRVDGKLTPVQEAAKTLLEMTNEFIDTPSNSEKVNALRQTMRDMINGSVDQVTKNDGKVRAVSEFMAYGLTEKFVTRDLKNTQYARPSIAKQLKTILLNMFGIKTNDGKAPIAKVSVFDKLVFETQTLSRDTSTTFSAAPVSTKAPEPAAVVPDPVVEPQPAEKLAEAPSVVEPSTPTPEPSAVADAPPQAAAVPVEATPPPVTAAASQPVETKTEATKEAAPPDLETVKAMQEELDTYESELEGSREQLAKYHAPLKDILSLEEFTAVAREASSKKEQSKLIKETAVYKSAISKIEAYEKANPEDMLIEVGLELAVDVVKDMRGSMYQIARMKNMIARENGEQEAKSAKADPVPAVAEPEVKQVTEKPKVKTPVEKAPAVAPVAPIKAIEKEASTTPKIQVGLNLAKNLYGEVEALGVYTFNPIFRYEDDVIELIKEARDAEKLDYKIDDAATMPMVESLLAQVESMIEGMTEKLNVDIRERKHSSGKTIYQILKDNREGKGPKQKDGSTVEALALAEGKSMAFLDDESLDTDVVRYDEHLLRLALMAAVDFVMNTPNGGGLYKTQDILDALGLNEAKDIPDGAYDVINFGRSAIDIKKALAKHIRDFWGAKVNKDAPRSLTEGLAEAMADDIMDYFQDLSKDTDAKDATQFWMKKAVVNLDTGETQTFVSFKLGEQGKEFGAAKTILRDVLTNKDSDSHKYRLGEGYSKKEISNTLKSDDNILVSEDKREAMFKQQNTPFKIAGGFFTMLESFGKDFSTVAEILGFQRMDDADQFFNDYDRKTIEGKNSSIKTSINQVLEQVERMRAYAELKGMDIEDVAAYYRLEISLNGRYFMQGFNPQSNKLAREIFSAAQSTVDLTSAGDVMVLFAAIGQAMDQSDLKIENLGLEGSAEYAKELVNTRYRPAIDAIKNRANLGDDARKALVEAMSDKDIESSARLLKALYTVAQYENALAAGEKTLDIDLAIELDGKTNGPITAAIQNNTEAFSPEFLALVRRGGFFIGPENLTHTSYADYQKTGREKKAKAKEQNKADNYGADLYEVTGAVMSTFLGVYNMALKKGQLTDGGKKKPGNIEAATRAQRLVIELIAELGEISIEPARTELDEQGNVKKIPTQITIKRKGTKSPITQNLYGARGKSISAGITRELFKMAYKEMTTAVRNKDGERLRRLASIMDELADIKIFKNRKTNLLHAWVNPTNKQRALTTAIDSKKLDNLKKFTFSAEQFERMSTAIELLYIPAFEDALSETVGPSVKEVNDTLVAATSNQANIYLVILNKALTELVTLQRIPLEKRTAEQLKISKTFIGKSGELSINDFNAVVDKYRKFAPLIDAAGSTFDLTGGDEETTTEVARRRAKQKAASTVTQRDIDKVEELTGDVSNINVGDTFGFIEATFNPRSETLSGSKSGSKRPAFTPAGVKILPYNVIANADVSMLTSVYNHVGISLDTLAVHDGIEVPLSKLREVSRIMNEAIQKTWMTNTIEPVLQSLNATQELIEELRDIEDRSPPDMFITKRFGETGSMIGFLLDDVRALERISDQRQAKIMALQSVGSTVDGAPGAQSPFVTKTDLTFNSEAELIKYLNDEMDRNYAELRDKRLSKTDANADFALEPEGGSQLRKEFTAATADSEAVKSPEDIKVGNQTVTRINMLKGGTLKFVEILKNQKMTDEQKFVLEQLIKSPAFKEAVEDGLQILIGPGGGGKITGTYNLETNQLILNNLMPETAIHELVHAVTVKQVWTNYKLGEDDTNVNRVQSIARLKSLMADFMSRDFPVNTAERHLKTLLTRYMTEGKTGPTVALNEFMAWSLSNEALIARGKVRIATDSLSQARALGKKVLEAMRRLLGFTSNKVFDQILFNTLVLAGTSTREFSAVGPAVSRQEIIAAIDPSSNDAARKITLLQLFTKQVSAYLDSRRTNDSELSRSARIAERAAEYTAAELKSLDALSRVSAAGFQIDTPQDILLFKSLQSMFSLDLSLDKLARLEAQKLFEAISKKLSPGVFLDLIVPAGTTPTQSHEIQADRMYRAAVGLPFVSDLDPNVQLTPSLDSKGLSDRLSVFMALAQTSSVMRQALENINFKELKLDVVDPDATGVDAALNNLTEKSIGAINRRVMTSKESQDKTVQDALDVLTEMLLQYETEAATGIENSVSGILNVMNTTLRGIIEATGQTVSTSLKEASERVADPTNPAASTALEKLTATTLGVMSSLSGMLVDNKAQASANELITLLNNPAVPDAIRNLFGEVLGITQDTKSVYQFVKAAKKQVSAVRQEFVEAVPKIVANGFSEVFRNGKKGESNDGLAKRLAADWAFMADGFSKTDVSLLMDTLGETYTLNLFGDSATKKGERQRVIKDIRKQIREQANVLGLSEALTDKIVNAYSLKAKQLSVFQATYVTGKNLLTSATSIVGLYNEDDLTLTKSEYAQLQKALVVARASNEADLNKLIYSVDMLTSLEAVHQLDDATHNRLRELITTEEAGVRNALAYAGDLRKQENAKSDNLGAKINGYKGYTFPTARRKYSVIVADDNQFADLALMGYVRIRDYKGIEERGLASTGKGYYFSAHTKLASYNQGALQTVQDTYNGVDPKTGLTVGPETTGEMIAGLGLPLLNRKIKAHKGRPLKDNLVPRFSSEGILIGYETMLAPDMIEMLQFSNNFAENLGRWSGRIQEEKIATGLNKALVDNLKAKYDEDKAAGREDEYARFGRVRDPITNELVLTDDLEKNKIWAESYFLIPKDVREYAHDLFDGHIMIRRDMINNSIGFRSASVSDVFTGRTNMNAKLRETIKDVFIATMGVNAYKYMTIAEEVVQTVVSEVKHTIVVKSGIILLANTMSNVVQLAGREVPLTYIAKRTRTKFAEVNQYKKNEDLKIKLRFDKLATTSKSAAAAIQSRIDAIEDSEKRMSIWPLIEANQFTTISEGITDADKALMDGKYMDWVEKKAGELPGPLSTVARYAIVSKDTALYQGLARAVQYSDFIAKAVYFDFMTEERGVSKEDALDRIDSEFINYDLNDSRARTYLESIGLTWFMNFKLRSLKVAASLLKNNPASVLLTGAGMSMIGVDVGSPVDDNIIAKTAEGQIGYSIGPGMVQAGWNLNIWNQLFNAAT